MRALSFTVTLLVSVLGCADEPTGEVVWPIANSAVEDADQIRSPYGPRDQSGSHDFHAGVDFAVPIGTKVRAIKAGTVEKVVKWDGQARSGNWVLIDHGDGEKSSYLHLDSTSVKVGAEVKPGKVLGRSGTTGSSSPHLHMNYMVGVDHKGADEAAARNPLEILPHSPMPAPGVRFDPDGVTLEFPAHPMTAQTILIEGQGESRTLDYAVIVALGNPDRDDPVQGGVKMSVTKTDTALFELSLKPDPDDFVPDHVVVLDYADEVILDATRS